MADFAARVNNVMRNYRHSEEVWFEHMTNWMDTYYSNPAGFENIWKAQAAQHNLTTADLTTFKYNVKTRHKPAYTMAKNSHELSPHTKPLMLEHVVDQLPLETEDDKKLAARAAQALMPILDVPFSMRSRDGWGALHCDELQTAISEARIGKGVQPPVITARYDVVAGGVGRGLAPTYNPPGADIEYAVAIQSYMVHLGKDPKTGVMSSARCKAVRQLVELAIQDAKNDRTVADAAVSSSWRFIFSKFMPLVVEYQANHNKLPCLCAARLGLCVSPLRTACCLQHGPWLALHMMLAHNSTHLSASFHGDVAKG